MGQAQVIVGDPGKQPQFQSVGLKQIAQTQEGAQLISSGKIFVLENTVFQGFRGGVYEVRPWQLSEDEIESMIDVDGTKKFVLGQIKAKEKARAEGNRREARDRENKEASAEFQALQLKELRDKMGIEPAPAEEPQPNLGPSLLEQAAKNPLEDKVNALTETVNKLAQVVLSQTSEKPHETEVSQIVTDPAPPESQVVCVDCGKQSPPRHTNPERWLQGHRRGKHKKS